MPGIVGLITKLPPERAVEDLQRMLRSVTHEPFYGAGTWMDEASGIYVAWTARSSALATRMKSSDESGNVVLVFSGEEFTRREAEDHVNRNGNSCSWLLKAFEKDSAFPLGLNGLFHGIVIDRSRGCAILFNDRYGMHRIYYHEAKDAFYFAVEAKAILAVRPELRAVDPRGLGEYVACGCVLENRTLFNGIDALPPASRWVLRDGRAEHKSTYFDRQDWENQTPLEPESYFNELRSTFQRTLPQYFSGPERIGMSLTGGLDTRLILAWQKPDPGTLPCYTFGGEFRDCRDVVVAKRVARECAQTHDVIQVGKDFLSRFPHYAERTVYLSDGCSGVNRAADLYVNERAREIAPVRMTGNYGDEVLRQIRVFKPVIPVPDLFDPEVAAEIERASQTYAASLQMHPLSFSVFRQAPWHHYGLLALEQTQLSVRTPYLDNDVIRTVFRAPASSAENNDLRVRLIGDASPALKRIRTDLGFGGTNGGLPAAAWQKYQQLTMKAEYTYDHGMPQWVARIDHALAPVHLERLFLGRHKFYHFRIWYRDALARYVREMLLDSQTLSRPYLQRDTLESIVQHHLRGDRNYTNAIHKVLSLELIHRLFIGSRQLAFSAAH